MRHVILGVAILKRPTSSSHYHRLSQSIMIPRTSSGLMYAEQVATAKVGQAVRGNAPSVAKYNSAVHTETAPASLGVSPVHLSRAVAGTTAGTELSRKSGSAQRMLMSSFPPARSPAHQSV